MHNYSVTVGTTQPNGCATVHHDWCTHIEPDSLPDFARKQIALTNVHAIGMTEYSRTSGRIVYTAYDPDGFLIWVNFRPLPS